MDILINPKNLVRIGELQNMRHDDASDGHATTARSRPSSAINCCWLLSLLPKQFTAADGGENIATDTYLV